MTESVIDCRPQNKCFVINARNIDGGVNVAAHSPDWTHLGGKR